MKDDREIRLFARVYDTAQAAESAFTAAESDYIGLSGVEVGFFRAFVPETGWVVAAVGPDASEGMLQGGSPVQLDPDVAAVLLRRFVALRPPDGRPAVVSAQYRPGLPVPVGHEHD
jgi:hypothetical protein